MFGNKNHLHHSTSSSSPSSLVPHPPQVAELDLRRTTFAIYQIEPNPASMATSTEVIRVVYGRYATYHTLENLSILDPELWMNLVDHALDDLHSNYEFSGEEYQDFATSRKDITAGRRTFSSAQATVRQIIGMDYNHARFIDTSSTTQNAVTERLQPDVQPTNVLQRLLKKTVEKFGERYSGWLKEHLNVVEELSSFLRPEVSRSLAYMVICQ